MELCFVAYRGAVALSERFAIQFDLAFCHLQPSMASVASFWLNLFPRPKQGNVQLRVLMNGGRSIFAIRRGNQA